MQHRSSASEPRLKRVFQGYRMAFTDDGQPIVRESVQVWDARAHAYRDTTIDTAIALTGALIQLLKEEPDAADRCVGRCAELRQELDRKGVKVFFDRGHDGRIYPKWKFALEGADRQERIHDVPSHILELVRERPEGYFNEPEYKTWYGPFMQRKREQIISERLAAEHPDAPAAGFADPAVSHRAGEAAPCEHCGGTGVRQKILLDRIAVLP